MGSRISKVYPDTDAYGHRIDGIDDLNDYFKEVKSEKGYCQISGSLMDGSFCCASRRKDFDIDLTWILNDPPLENVRLESAGEGTNYVRFIRPHRRTAQVERFLDGDKISPDKVKQQYSPILEEFTKAFCPEGLDIGNKWYEALNKIVHIDMTPAIAFKCDATKLHPPHETYNECSPSVADRLRERFASGWLPRRALEEILSADIYLIPKAINKAKQLDTWRLSFSNAENVLFREMKPIQRQAYAILKLVSDNIGIMTVRPDFLITYHLKNILLWSVEEDVALWNKPNWDIRESIKHLLKKLNKAVTDQKIRWYFLSDVNILPKVDKTDMHTVTDRIQKFLALPDSDLILKAVPPFPFVEGELEKGATMFLHILAGHLTMLIAKNVVGMMLYDIRNEHRGGCQRRKTGKLFVLHICQLIGISSESIEAMKPKTKVEELTYENARYDDPSLDIIKRKICSSLIGTKIKEMPVLSNEEYCQIYNGQDVYLDEENPALKLFRKEHMDAIYDCADFLLVLFDRIKQMKYASEMYSQTHSHGHHQPVMRKARTSRQDNKYGPY